MLKKPQIILIVVGSVLTFILIIQALYNEVSSSFWKAEVFTGYNEVHRQDNFRNAMVKVEDLAVVGVEPDCRYEKETCSAAYLLQDRIQAWKQIAKLTPSKTSRDSRFGYSVAFDLKTIVVGDILDDEKGTDSGSIFIFEKPGGGWSDMQETFKITLNEGNAFDHFGSSVAVHGNYILVGAEETNYKNGSAYIFERNTSGWLQVAKLSAADGSENDDFGCSVYLNKNLAIVGARGDDPNGKFSGSVYIFEKPKYGWKSKTHSYKLISDKGDNYSRFGFQVYMKNDTVCIGAHKYNPQNRSQNYLSYKYLKKDTSWVLVNKSWFNKP